MTVRDVELVYAEGEHLKRHAYHEAGHAIVARALGFEVRRLRLVSPRDAAGLDRSRCWYARPGDPGQGDVQQPTIPLGSAEVDEMYRRAAVLLAGTESEHIAAAAMDPADGQAAAKLAESYRHDQPGVDTIAAMLGLDDEESRVFVSLARARGRAILARNRYALDGLAAAAAEKRVLERHAIDSLLGWVRP